MTKKSKTPISKTSKTVITSPFGACQGDVPILRVASLSEGATPTKERIVAYGETTGHHHEIIGDVDCFQVVRTLEGQLFKGMEVVVTEGKPAHIFHNGGGEHATIEMTPGIYFIPAPGQQQVEYDGAQERRVMD